MRRIQRTRSAIPLSLLMLFLVSSLSACASAQVLAGVQVTGAAPAADSTQAAQTPLPAASATASPMPTEAYTPTPQVPAVPARLLYHGEEVSVPILLYHHVSDEQPEYRYYTHPAVFREHMEALREAGWTAITTAALADMLLGNAPLPEKALVITFDDGTLDVYQNAFPVMREMGYPGVFFLVSQAVGSEGYAKPDQLKEMAAAGWEIGSHSMTHTDLTKEGTNLGQEMYQSAVQIETAVDVPVRSFAYPFSAGSENLYRLAPQYGYTNASCAGWNNRQSALNLFCLSRREVKAGTTAEELLKLVAEP